MSNRDRLLQLLADGQLHSGEELGQKLAVSRAAVWKTVQTLQSNGLPVTGVKGRGYRLREPLELLSRDHLLHAIDPDSRKQLAALTLLSEVDSTNRYLLDRIGQSGFRGHVVLAEYQTAGRGRRGNAWLTPFAGGIALSAGWQFDTPPAAPGVVSLALAVAVIDTLAAFGINGAGLKWPNDVLYQQKKLAGILVEMRGELVGTCQIVAGIGLNYHLPDGVTGFRERPAIDIASICDPRPSRNLLTARLISEVLKLLSTFENMDMRELLERWRQYDCITGRTVTLETPAGPVRGRVEGIDESGSLLLHSGNRTRSYTSGDISLRL